MTTVGEEIAQARAARGLTVEDVAAGTRIRASVIAAIEAGDFSSLGEPVYVRGHLRTIAGIVGLDPDALLARYDAGG